MTDSRTEVLIVGTGDMARKHIAGYRSLADVHVAAVVGRSRERAEALTQEADIPACHYDLRSAIEAVQPDIASVCLPTHLHPEATIRLLESGVHVLCEKPIALDLQSARRMIDAADKAGRKLSVIFNRRFSSSFADYSGRLASLGEPLIYRVDDCRQVRPKSAMHSTDRNAGPVIDCAVHDFDLLHHLFGEATQVFASGNIFSVDKALPFAEDRLAVDTAQVHVDYENGARAEIFYGWAFPRRPEEYWIERQFMGPKGIVRVIGDFGDVIEHYRRDGKKEWIGRFVPDGHREIIRRFVEAVRNDMAVPVDPEDAVVALRLSLAAVESIGSGQIVSMR